jgi:hypothetical protein
MPVQLLVNRSPLKCPYCRDGWNMVLRNPTDFYHFALPPEYEQEYCEECGGTGFLEVENTTADGGDSDG